MPWTSDPPLLTFRAPFVLSLAHASGSVTFLADASGSDRVILRRFYLRLHVLQQLVERLAVHVVLEQRRGLVRPPQRPRMDPHAVVGALVGNHRQRALVVRLAGHDLL